MGEEQQLKQQQFEQQSVRWGGGKIVHAGSIARVRFSQTGRIDTDVRARAARLGAFAGSGRHIEELSCSTLHPFKTRRGERVCVCVRVCV